MASVRVTMNVCGFTEIEARNGLPNLLDEFHHRPWVLCPTVKWNSESGCLVITVGYESDDIEACKNAAKDEVWNCVIACIQFSSDKISFEIKDASYALGT